MTHEDKLIKRMEQGDRNAADELIGIFYPEILRYCLWHAPNRSLAEDAAQETFLKVIRYFDRYTHRGRFKPFLYQIAANTCIDMQRKRYWKDVALEEVSAESVYWEPGFEDVQSDMVVKKLIKNLPTDLQEIIILRFGQDLTFREIAQVADLRFKNSTIQITFCSEENKKGNGERGGVVKEQDVEKKLKRALHQPCPTGREKHFEETIWLVREELVQKKKRGRFSFLRFLLMQTRYIGWKIWGIQGYNWR